MELGNLLAETFDEELSPELLPNNRMYYNIATRTVEPMMLNNHQLITYQTQRIQSDLNEKAGLQIIGQVSEVNRSRIDGIIERLSTDDSFENIKWILNEPIINFSQSIVDEMIDVNANFHLESGLNPQIIRTAESNACDWCKRLEGAWDYSTVPRDVFRRHKYCQCEVEYRPGDGRRQNVHSKNWQS